MIDIPTWLSLLTVLYMTGVNCECGQETVVASTTGLLGHKEYVYRSTENEYSQLTSAFKTYFTITDPTDDSSCSTLTYTLLGDLGLANTDDDFSIDEGKFKVVITSVFAPKNVTLKATSTGGSSTAQITLTYGVVNPGCTYSQSGTTTYSLYFNPTLAGSFKWKTIFPCQFTSSRNRATDCPLSKLIMHTDATGLAAGATTKDYLDETNAADKYAKGDSKTQYYTAGLLGDRFLDKVLVSSDTICSFSYYACGKETIAAAETGALTVKRGLKQSGTYIMDETTLSKLFTIDTTATNAYAGCNITTYELVTDDLTTAYTATTYVTYKAGTGLTWKLSTAVSEESIYLKVTTIGGVSATKELKYTVIQCGDETIALKTGLGLVTYGSEKLAGKVVSFDEESSKIYFTVSGATDPACEFLTYRLRTSTGWSFSHANIKINTLGYLEIKYSTNWGINYPRLYGKTPGGAEVFVPTNIIAANTGCSYTLGATASQDFYLNPNTNYTIDYTSDDYECKWTSSNQYDTQCTNKFSILYKSKEGNSGEAIQYVKNSISATIASGTYSAGNTVTHYRAMGIPGNSSAGTHVVRGDICTEKYYMCGMETVSLVDSAAYVLKKAKKTSGTFVMNNTALAEFFKIDHTAATAYSGCSAETYQLVQSDGTTPYTNTKYVTIKATTGLTWKLWTAVEDAQIYVKMTTTGGISAVKPINFTIRACGSENITTTNNYIPHWETIYNTNVKGDTYKISAKDLASYFNVSDTTEVCSNLTYTITGIHGALFNTPLYKIDTDSNLSILIQNTLEANTNMFIRATTPGGKYAKVKFLIKCNKPGCTYDHSGETKMLEYYKPTDKVDYDFTKNACKFTSSSILWTDCPLYMIYVTDAQGATFSTDKNISMLSSNLVYAANEYEAGGFPGSTFYKVGLPGNPLKDKLLTEAGKVCTYTPHFCGLETITEASAGSKKFSYKKSTTNVTTVIIPKSDIEALFKTDISAFDADAKGANWTGCINNTYALLGSNNKTAYSNSSRATFNTSSVKLTIKTGEVVSYIMYLKATTVGGISFSKKIEVEIKNNCVASIFSANSTPAMTNNLTIGSDSYQIYERVAYIGAKSSTLTANFSTDVAFTTSFPIDCPIATWSIKSSLTATTSLSSGTAYATDAATQKFATDAPAIHNYYYTVSTKDPVSKTINYKIAVCGLEKVAVNDTTELKITKYYNEFKKDYEHSKYYAESIYSAWFSLNTTTLVTEKLVADKVEADMFKNGCPINDYILCKDTDCLEAHAETSLFYLDYQTKAQITSNGTLNADGTEPAAATRRILATAPTIPYTYDAFNITKVSTRNTTELYSRIVMKIDTVYSPQTAYLAAITTGYAMGGRNITFENKCGLEYVYPSKTQYDFQLQAENGFYTIQATDYQNWFKSTFTACPIVKYEIRSFASTVKVDNNLADGTYLKFTDEYLAAQGVTDTTIPSVKASSQLVDGLAYKFCHNSLTDSGVACTSAKQGGFTLSQYSFGTDDIMQRVEILSSGQLQINTDGIVVEEDKTNTYAVDVVAISEGGAEGFAHLKLEFIAKREAANNPPAFASTPPDVTIDKVDDNAQVYTSPSVSDLDGDTVTISVKGNIYAFINIQTSDTNFLLNIDHSQITEDLDGKSFTLKVELTDGKDTTKYEVKGQINWNVPEPEPEPIPEPVVEEAVVEIPEEAKMPLQENELEIAAEVAAWQAVASPETMNAIFAEIKPPPSPPVDPKKPKKKKKAVKVKESPITRNGKFPVNFNQKMKIPGFLDTGSPEGSRLLGEGPAKIPISQLDVGRDIFNVRFVLASEIDPKDIKYFLQIDKWDDSGIEIFLNFTEPLLLSRGDDRDFAEITVKRPQLFISEETGEMIDTSSLVFYQTLPRQLPKGVEEKGMKDQAGDMGKGLESMAYIQIGLQFVIKGIMADLMTTFYCLQLCCFFTIYKVKIPGNSEIYIDEFRKLINMDAAKPDNVLKQIDEEYSIDYFMNLSKERISSAAESSGMQTSNFAKNMSTYLFIGTCISFGIIFMAALTCLKSKFQALIKEKLNQTVNKIFFNGQIKAQTVAYLATAIAFSTSLQYMDFESKTRGELWAEVGIPLLLVGLYPFVCLFVLLKFRPHLAKPRFRKKIGNMYEGVHLTRNKFTILFYPMYLFRRAVFVCIPIMFWFETAFQVQVLMFMNYGFSVYFFGVQPISDPLKMKMQAFNEGMMLVITYHMFYFTDFANVKFQFFMGYSFVFTLCAILFVNIFKMLQNTVEGWLSDRRKKANQKAYEKAYNDWVNIQINEKARRKEERERLRVEKIERAKKAMQMFKDSDLITKLKADILKRQEEKKKQDSMSNIKNALGGFFNKNSTKNGGNAMASLFAKKPDSPKIKQPMKMNMLQLSLKKKLDLTKINETAGEEGTARGIFDPIKEQKKKERVEAAKNEFDLAFKNLFAKNESDSEEVELTEEDIELNKLIASLSFLDRTTYRKNIDLVKKLIKMDKQIADKRWGSDLPLEETIDLMNTINEENKMILPMEAIRFQHRKIIGQNYPEENALGTAEDWFDIFQDAIKIEVSRIRMQQDKIELKNKVGKYHYLKEEEKKAEENVFDLDALDQELAYGQPVQDEDSDIDIELPEKLRNKKKNQVGLFAGGVAVVGTGVVVGKNLDDSRHDDAEDALSNGRQEDEEGPDGEGSAVPGFGFAMAKMKYIGASGLVFAGILEKEDLPPDPSEEEKKAVEEEEKVVELEDEDSASDDEDGEVDLDDEGGRGKKKKKRGGVVDMDAEEEEEDVPDDY